MATVLLGNAAPVEAPTGASALVNGEHPQDRKLLDGKTIVLIETPDTDNAGEPLPLDKQLAEVRSAFALHSADHAVWVESGDEFFAKAVGQIFNCSVGRPKDWDAPEGDPEPSSAPDRARGVPTVSRVKTEPQEA